MGDRKRPGGGDAGSGSNLVEVGNAAKFTPFNYQTQARQEPAPADLQPPICRGRAWEDYRRREISSEREQLANELNHKLAKAFNEAIQYIDQSEPDQYEWYWRCHAELFSLLDTVFLLMREMDVSDEEAATIAAATRKHFSRAMARWRTHQLELMEEALAFYDAALKPSPKLPLKSKPASWKAWSQQWRGAKP